jgi:hypothetical protein
MTPAIMTIPVVTVETTLAKFQPVRLALNLRFASTDFGKRKFEATAMVASIQSKPDCLLRYQRPNLRQRCLCEDCVACVIGVEKLGIEELRDGDIASW